MTNAFALLLGVAFGALLERAGLGRAATLVGQFYWRNLIVLKVLFSALVTAMLGAFWLEWAGLLDLQQVYLPETFLAPQAIGGALFGAGLVLAGLCPGTACVAVATGRHDGLWVIAGLMLGIGAFNVSFGLLRPVFEVTPRGAMTIPETLDISRGVAVALISAMAVGLFILLDRLETRERHE